MAPRIICVCYHLEQPYLHPCIPGVNICVAVCCRFLIDRGADLSLVNNDGDLAIDIADSDEMECLLQQEIETRGKQDYRVPLC